MNPETVFIQGDLSRADVIELVRLCRGKRVVEFGMGGSTLILARCAASLASYETDRRWLDRTWKRMKKITDTCSFSLDMWSGQLVDFGDALFVDGEAKHRATWLREYAGEFATVIVHDSRQPDDFSSAMQAMQSHFLQIESIDCHVNNSNLLVFHMRPEPLVYVNWNEAEKDDNRSMKSWTDSRYWTRGEGS